MALHFIKNHKNKPEVNHKWGKKYDNRSSQLEWHTHRENVKDSYKKGLKSGKKGEASHFAKLTTKEVKQIKALKQKGASSFELAKKYNISSSYVTEIYKNKTWRHLKN